MEFISRRTCAALAVGACLAWGAATSARAERVPAPAESTPDAPGREDAAVDLPMVRSAADPASEDTLDVGSIEALDLDALRSLIARAKPIDTNADAETRRLTLEECLQIALTHNLDISLSEYAVAAGRDVVSAQKAEFHPEVGVTGDASGWKLDRSGSRPDETLNRERALAFVQQKLPTGGVVRLGAGYEREFTSKNSEQNVDVNFDNTRELAGLSLEVVQPLLAGGRIFVARAPIMDAEYDEEVNQALLSSSMLRVKAVTKEAYYNVVRAARQVEVVERALDRDRELVEASSALYDAGRVSKVDVYSADVGLANDQVRLASSVAELEAQQNELRRILGLPVDVRIEAADEQIAFSPVRIDLEDWITRALRNRPEIMQRRAELKRADLSKRVAKNAKLPELDVSGSIQPGFDWASYNWRGALGFRMPIGNKGPEAMYRQAESLRSMAQTQLVQTQRAIDLEVRSLEISLRENLERLTSLISAVESARAKREVAAGRFELGLASNLDVVNADEELIAAESQLLRAVADYASTVAFLESAVGGSL